MERSSPAAQCHLCVPAPQGQGMSLHQSPFLLPFFFSLSGFLQAKLGERREFCILNRSCCTLIFEVISGRKNKELCNTAQQPQYALCVQQGMHSLVAQMLHVLSHCVCN